MTKLSNCFALAAALLLSAAAVAADEAVKIPTLAMTPQLLDGEIVDPCWEKAYRTGPFCRINGETITEGAEAWIFASADKLYIAVKCEVKDRDKLEKEIAKAKSWINLDPVEIFIDPGDTGNYVHYGVNAAGIIAKPKIADDLRFGVQVHEKDWTLEMEIPFATIPVASEKGNGPWKMNICRGNYPIKEHLSWAKLDGSFHDPAHFKSVTGLNADLKAIYNRQQLLKRKDFTVELDRLIACGRDTLGVKADLNTIRSMKGWKLEASLSGGAFGDSVRPAVTIAPLLLTNEFKVPIKGLADGRYQIAVSVKDADGKEVFAETSDFRIAPPAKPRKRNFTIENGNFFENGKLFFPIGVWDSGWGPSVRREKVGKESKLVANITDKAAVVASNELFFADFAAHGINCCINSDWNFSEEDEDDIFKVGKGAPWDRGKFVGGKAAGMSFHDYCEIAARHGVGMIVRSTYLKDFAPKNLDLFVQQMLRIRDEENIIFWHTADETDGSIAWNALRHRLHHEIDPARVTWLNVINAVAPNKDNADILSTDPYPVPTTRLTAVASHADRLKKIMGENPKQTQFIWIQDFGGEGSWTRPPTPEERRVMALLALTHGVKGIFYFNYYKPEWRNGVRQHKDAWDTITALNAEIQKYAPITCLGKFLGTQRIGYVDVSVYEYEGKKTVFIINTDKEPVKGVKIDLPGVYSGETDLDGFDIQIKEL